MEKKRKPEAVMVTAVYLLSPRLGVFVTAGFPYPEYNVGDPDLWVTGRGLNESVKTFYSPFPWTEATR